MAAPRYFLQENGLRTGPHSLLVLKQKAEIHIISPETSIAPENEPDQWFAIRESEVLCEEFFPTHVAYRLRDDRPVEHINDSSEPPALSVDEMLRTNLAHQKAAEGELLRPLPPRPNRRLRDYCWTVIACGVVTMIPWIFTPLTAGLMLLSLAATVFFAFCAAWVFFFVMERY